MITLVWICTVTLDILYIHAYDDANKICLQFWPYRVCILSVYVVFLYSVHAVV